ncbi:hypothetical protein [Pseudomonas sp. 18173]|uniref:hypothetical protein n=1 Tax=Pseudomonas sp. 18173 TaxID=3390055 RepID=UPI003D1AB7F9
MLLKALVIWSLLSIIIAAVLCRLVHNAKVAERSRNIARTDRQPHGRKLGSASMIRGKSGDDDSDRHAA